MAVLCPHSGITSIVDPFVVCAGPTDLGLGECGQWKPHSGVGWRRVLLRVLTRMWLTGKSPVYPLALAFLALGQRQF